MGYSALDISIPAPTHTGYTFTGWTGSNGTTPQKTITIAKGSTGNRSYTANWSANTYTVSYSLNGGTVSSNPTAYTVETATMTLNIPTKAGWTFTGWSGTGLSGNANKTVTIAKGSTGNRSYTAHFSKTITLTQKDLYHTITQSYTLHDSESSHAFTLSTSTDSASGWTFIGWRDSATPGPKQYDTTGTITLSDNKTVYVTYARVMTATFIDYAGTNKQTRTVSGTAYGNNQCGGVVNQYPTVTAPSQGTYTGWVSKGWTTGTDGNAAVNLAAGANVTLAEDKTYYGRYEQSVTLSFEANGGDSKPSTQSSTRQANSYEISKTNDPSFKLPKAIARKGYTFKGWRISSPINAVKAAESTITPTSSVQLSATAEWEANTYVVSIPKAVSYHNMSAGQANTSDSYDISVKHKTGSFAGTVNVSSQASNLTAPDGSKLNASASSASTPLTFTSDGTQKDTVKISGNAQTASKWKGYVQYNVKINP